ncbi:MAG TPA: hypothetical protein VJ385_06215 [Fibrobacteria bacterium]|nr:hypothetical protein [Fibrobacteria bacterium]
MIRTIEEFLSAFNENSPGGMSMELDGDELHYDYFWGSMLTELDSGLVRQLERLGILYTFGGGLEINPMAIRILKKMRADGKELSAEAFRNEVEASKELYHANHLDGEMAPF